MAWVVLVGQGTVKDMMLFRLRQQLGQNKLEMIALLGFNIEFLILCRYELL